MPQKAKKDKIAKAGPSVIGHDVGEIIATAYVEWSLFLSSYVPLLGIFAIRLWPKHPGYAFWACVAGAIVALNLSLVMNVRTAPRDFSVKSTEGGGSEIAAYIATYILPFLVVSDVAATDFIAYALLIVIIGIVMTREGSLHVNPLLGAFGMRLATITTEDDERYYVISSRRIRIGDTVRGISLQPRLLFER